MIQNPADFGRRILSFPAVHPCEGVSPATLLTSLINVGQNLCGYGSKFFASNRRNGKEAIRQIGILLMLFEEIRDSNSNLPDSVVLCFSELHLIFQKLRYLLEDITREGARLLMLMESELVANYLNVLVRSIATALEVLPLDSIDVPVEVKEHVELLMEQSRRARFGVDRNDDEMRKEVALILSRFEDGETPEESKLKRILDYVGIGKWSLCNKEVKFLDSEIEIEWTSQGRGEVSFLSNLMSFMSYCRCVLFEVVDREVRREADRCSSDVVYGLNADDFRCPISLDFMADPVTVETGHTYDRSSITKWLRSGNSICPNTGEKLKNKDLVPNLALLRMIQQYCTENSIPFAESCKRRRDITRTVFAGSSTAEKIIQSQAKFLARLLESGTGEEKNRAAYEIKLLCKSSIVHRSFLVETGLIPYLLELLRSLDALTQENAIAAVLNLSKHSQSKTIIVENGGLQEIIHVLKKGLKTEAQELAAGTLFYIASIEEYRKVIGETPDALPALVDLLKHGSDRGKKNAMVTLIWLLMYSGNHRKILAAGAVPLLLTQLKSEKDNLITESMAILASLAEKPDGTAAILRGGALSSIIELLDSCGSKAGKEYCVSLLLALCINGGSEVVQVLVKSPALMSSLYNLVSEGTSRASKKANAVIRILHEYCERMSSSSVPLGFPLLQERTVHVW